MWIFFQPRPSKPGWANSGIAAFTLVEVLVTLTVTLIILVTLVQFVGNVDQLWKSTASDPFAGAEEAFDIMTDQLARASLDSYQDYADSTGAFPDPASTTPFVPDHLARRSDLAFVCGASSGPDGLLTNSGRTTSGESVFFLMRQGYTQTDRHLGMEHLLNALGYFVEFGDQNPAPAFILSPVHRWRWRLKAVIQPAESLQIYSLPTSAAWVQQAVQTGAPTSILATNIIALVILPERAANDTGAALAPTYQYDSRDSSNPLTRNQLPPRLRVALVAIDEISAQILASQNGSQPPALVPGNLFATAAQFDADLTTLDTQLTTQKITHRIFERDLSLPAAAWSNTPSQ